jgi:hypothetical protein
MGGRSEEYKQAWYSNEIYVLTISEFLAGLRIPLTLTHFLCEDRGSIGAYAAVIIILSCSFKYSP